MASRPGARTTQRQPEGRPVTATTTAAADADRKRFEKLRALLALRGHELYKTDAGPYLVRRWGLVRDLPDLGAVEGFARQVGVRE